MLLIDGREHDLGGGMKVRRILPFAKKRMVGPFIFLDQMGPVTIPAEINMDVRPHPHIGLSTLTYLFKGRLIHRDSLGFVQEIVPGQVNWMISGSGIAHSERAHPDDRRRGHELHGLQFWVALPDGKEDRPPAFHHYETLPEQTTPTRRLKLIAGTAFGLESPLAAQSPMLLAEVFTQGRDDLSLDLKGFELGIYVLAGQVRVGDRQIQPLQLAVLDGPEHVIAEGGSHYVVLGGEPFATERLIWWNLVSSSRERILEAQRAWKDGLFPQVPGESEFIPLPDTPF